jgi:hypothetical protein
LERVETDLDLSFSVTGFEGLPVPGKTDVFVPEVIFVQLTLKLDLLIGCLLGMTITFIFATSEGS